MGMPLGASAWLGRAAKADTAPVQTAAAADDADALTALVHEARQGSEAAFSALFERFQTPIVNYLYRLVGDWDVANDLAQDSFLKAYTALPRTADNLQISPWLYRIVTNTALDALRRRKRITWLPLDSDVEHPSHVPDTAIRQAEGDAIQQALAQVPPDQRTCLVLNMSQGMTYKEIAETLGISINLVAVRIFRGREKFIEAYKKANAE